MQVVLDSSMEVIESLHPRYHLMKRSNLHKLELPTSALPNLAVAPTPPAYENWTMYDSRSAVFKGVEYNNRSK